MKTILSLTAILMVLMGMYLITTGYTQELIRQKCNLSYNTRGPLSTDDGYGTVFFTNSIETASTSDQIAVLLRQNKETREQLNRLTYLFGCYFDK